MWVQPRNTVFYFCQICIILLIYFRPQTLYAQAYPNINPNYIYYYNYQAVYIDSIRTEGFDSIYIFRKLPKDTNNWGGKCLPMTLYTFLGPQLIKREGKYILFNQFYDSIYLDLNQNGSWYLMHKNDSLHLNIYAKVTGQTFDSIFEEMDSVIHLSLLVLNFNGDTLKNHKISLTELKISSKYGWIVSLNWNRFPYYEAYDGQIKLVGLMAKNGSVRKGVYNKYPQHTQVHDVGDEIHEESFYASISSGKFRTQSHFQQTIRIILSKVIYADSTVYSVYRNKYNHYYFGGYLPKDDSVYNEQKIDTINYSIDFSKDRFPYTLNAFYEFIPGVYYNNYYFDNTYKRWAYPNFSYTQWMNSKSFNGNCWIHKIFPGDPIPKSIYYDGIGGPYYEYHNGYYSEYGKLIYFNTRKGKWGIPLGMKGMEFSPTFKVFPNPAKDRLSIETGRSYLVLLILFDLTMHEVLKVQVKNLEPITLPILESGIYIYQILDQQRNSNSSGKLLIVWD